MLVKGDLNVTLYKLIYSFPLLLERFNVISVFKKVSIFLIFEKKYQLLTTLTTCQVSICVFFSFLIFLNILIFLSKFFMPRVRSLVWHVALSATWQHWHVSMSNVIVLISIYFIYMSLWSNLIPTYISLIQFSLNFFFQIRVIPSLNWNQNYDLYKCYTNSFIKSFF